MYQVIQFLFSLVLVVSVQRVLSQAIAQTFHKTAFKERLDAVSETLHVIETLSDYEPVRSHQKRPSGTRTPTFFSKSPSRSGSQPNSRPASTVVGFKDDGHIADSENEDSPKAKGKRRSAFLLNVRGDPNNPSVPTPSAHSYPPTPLSGANTPTRRRDSHDLDGAGAAAGALGTGVLHDARNLRPEEQRRRG